MKTKKITVLLVSYQEVDKAVRAFLKSKKIKLHSEPYSCLEFQDWSNNQEHLFDIDKHISDEDIERVQSGDVYFSLSEILHWMCKDGVLAKGQYLVQIYW